MPCFVSLVGNLEVVALNEKGNAQFCSPVDDLISRLIFNLFSLPAPSPLQENPPGQNPAPLRGVQFGLPVQGRPRLAPGGARLRKARGKGQGEEAQAEENQGGGDVRQVRRQHVEPEEAHEGVQQEGKEGEGVRQEAGTLQMFFFHVP